MIWDPLMVVAHFWWLHKAHWSHHRHCNHCSYHQIDNEYWWSETPWWPSTTFDDCTTHKAHWSRHHHCHHLILSIIIFHIIRIIMIWDLLMVVAHFWWLHKAHWRRNHHQESSTFDAYLRCHCPHQDNWHHHFRYYCKYKLSTFSVWIFTSRYMNPINHLKLMTVQYWSHFCHHHLGSVPIKNTIWLVIITIIIV